jgi:hypothetical protein
VQFARGGSKKSTSVVIDGQLNGFRPLVFICWRENPGNLRALWNLN